MRKTKRPVVYTDLQSRWREIGPLFRSRECASIWIPCMSEYMQQKSSNPKWKFKFDSGKYRTPSDFDSCDWRWEAKRKGRHPAFWDYACYRACHWVADMCLFVAISSEPGFPWRIISSEKHTVVWNGLLEFPILFDINFSAMGVPAKESWALAHGKGSKTLDPWQWHKDYLIPKKLKTRCE